MTVKTTIIVSGNPDLDTLDCPLPLEVIPNKMGINLCSVKSVEWTKQDDGQLVSLSILFNPSPKEVTSDPSATDTCINLRCVEVLVETEHDIMWSPCLLKDVKQGQTFRMFEPDGTQL